MTTGGARNSLDLVLIWPYLGICTARAVVKWSSRCLAKSAYSHLLRPLVLPLQMKSAQNNGHVLSSSRYQLANQLPSTVPYFKKCSSISSNETQQADEHRQLKAENCVLYFVLNAWSAVLKTIRDQMYQDCWNTQDGRMTKNCRARLCIPGLARHFFVILRPEPSCRPVAWGPFCGVTSLDSR